MRPSDSLAPSVTAPVPLAVAYHGRTLVLDRTPQASETRDALEILGPAPRTGIYRGETRASQVAWLSSSYAPWPHTSPVCHLLAHSRR
jgi:hypothetical protein